MAISTSPIPTTPAELDAIKRRLQDPTIDIAKLQQYATGSMASIPGYLALGELSRRSSLIQNQQAQGANPPPPPTILQQQAQQAQGPQQGIAQGMPQGMPPGAPPPQGGQMPPQAPPQMPQQPPQPPVAAAGGGLMHLPMRPDMFRRSDYAHGGVVHFEEAGRVPEPKSRFEEDISSVGSGLGGIFEDIGEFINAPVKRAKKYFSPRDRYAEQDLETGPGQKVTTTTPGPVKDPNAGMERLPNVPSTGGGSGLGINKDIRETLDYLKKQRNEPLPKAQSIEEQEAEREKRGLDKLPTTDTSQLQDVLKSYNKPRTWDENLQLMAEDAANARPGRGFGNMALGRSGRALDAANREKSIAISLKLEEIKNLDAKAQFAFKNGNFEAAKKYTQEAEKLKADIMEKRSTIAAHTLTGLASLERANNAGAAGGAKGATTLSESTITKAKTNINEFVNSPRLDSEFWDFVPDGEEIKKKIKVGKKPGNANYDSAMADLQRYKSEIYNGYVSDLRGERAVATKKQVK